MTVMGRRVALGGGAWGVWERRVVLGRRRPQGRLPKEAQPNLKLLFLIEHSV